MQIEIYLIVNSIKSLILHDKLGLPGVSLALVVVFLSFSLILFIYTEINNRVEAQLETVNSREILITLENGTTLSTKGELVVPASGKGPYPAVLLIPGSGIADRNEYLPPEVSGVDGGSKPFLQIAEYLAERGFVVLKYDKRGIGENATVIDASLFGNATVHSLQQDAESALKVLLQQPEVDKTNITVIGHSEGAVIAPRLAVFGENSDSIKNVVMLGASAQTLYDLVIEKANQKLNDARNLWDANDDGQLSIDEVIIFPDAQLTVPVSNTTNSNNNNRSNSTSNDNLNFSHTKMQQWYPGIDIDNDNFIDIENEMVPFVQTLLSQIDTDPWYTSHKEIIPTAEILGNLTHKDILIMQGEEDVQTTLEQALVLEQKLTEIRHTDHTLKTYPGLGHTFFPQQGPNELLGPIQDHVLADLYAWLKDNDRDR
jgi:alpha-beta hydrolase superfamily lysophospholipase